jgi:hypothetical protein
MPSIPKCCTAAPETYYMDIQHGEEDLTTSWDAFRIPKFSNTIRELEEKWRLVQRGRTFKKYRLRANDFNSSLSVFVPCYLLGNKFTFVRLCVRVKAQREKVRRKRRWCRFRFSRYRDIWKEIDFPFSCLVRWRWQLVFLLTIVPLLYLFKDFESCVLYIGSLHLRSIYRLPWPVKFVFLFFSLIRLQNLKLKTFPSVASPTLLLTYRHIVMLTMFAWAFVNTKKRTL